MDSDTPHEEISLRTVLDAVNRQKQDIEVLVDTKISEKINSLRDEIHGTNQSMKSQIKKLKSDSQYKWRFEGNKIQFNYNTENLEDLTQAIWAIDNGKVDYARDIVASCTDRLKHRNKLIKIADTLMEGGIPSPLRQTLLLAILKISPRLSGLKTGPLGRKRLRANQQLNNSRFLPPLALASTLNSPSEGGSRLGMEVSRMPRKSTLENLNGDHASTVGRINTGELTAPSKTTRQQHHTKETSFVKDEYNFDISSLDNEYAQNFTHDYYEYEQDGTDIIVKGRLKENIQFWINIGAYDYIIDTIRDGYKIPFYSIPPSTYLHNNLSALKNSDFVHTAIQDLLHRGLIVQCDNRHFVVNPLTVSVQSNLKKRLILDLRAAEKSLWLGTFIDTENGFYKIPDNRINKMIHSIDGIISSLTWRKSVYVKKVASVVGQIISTYLVIGNLVYLMTKHLTIDVNTSASWYSYIKHSESSIEQLQFWKLYISEVNVKHFSVDESCHSIIYSDASDTGFGGYIVETPQNIAHGMWVESERSNSSTWKELSAVKKVLLSLINIISGKKVKWFTDNQNVVSIVSKGSTKTILQNLALDIFSACLKYNVNIDIVWIPRTQNEKADFLSRIVDHDDWGISYYIFQLIESLWGPHEVDWFASDHNFKLLVFYSRFWNENSSGIDGFTVDWYGVNGLFVLPVFLIPRVINYMRQCNAVGTLIVPCWPSASYWPMLCPNGGDFTDQVTAYVELPSGKEFYTPGKSKNAIFGNTDLKFKMLALRLDFRE
ncbi:unnamed protein product [Mytilus coruscus]|uniref:RNase H type-1 domain-containing protein n=1 Tax=Mytilus coruscus TaxID=42192 RepID=A0A6J8ERV1_MYTCO|nr:unnamed protein product [Mytilus coruscus]